jgi:hypothetical protein
MEHWRNKNMTKKIYFGQFNSLGDHFVINGIVRHYAQFADEVYLHSYSHDTLSHLYSEEPKITVLRDSDPKPVPDEENPYLYHYPPNSPEHHWFYPINPLEKYRFLSSDPSTMSWNGHPDFFYTVPLWDRQLYELADLPFSMRYTNFRLPSSLPNSDKLYEELVGDGKPYVLVADIMRLTNEPAPIMLDAVRSHFGLNPSAKVIRIDPTTTTNMLDYTKLVANADEIHVVPSAFHCFVDSVPTKPGAKMFFHDIRANSIMRLNTIWNKDKQWIEINYSRKM